MQINKFYTFYDFNYRSGYPPFKPLIQYHLKRRMECLVNSHPNRDGSAWVNYFVDIIKHSSYSELEKQWTYWHLLAYLDLDRCYLIWRNFRNFPFYSVKSQEIYDLTNNLLFQSDKFQKYIERYDAHNLSGANLKTYLLGIVKNTLREKLALTSSWRILCDVDINSLIKFDRALKKRREALERYGVTEPYRSRYIFALRYFIPIYKNNRIYDPQRIEGSKWPEPEPLDFAEAASYYNSQRFTGNAPLQAAAGAEVSAETVKKWMYICLKALQFYPRISEIPYNLGNYEQQNSEAKIFWSTEELEEESGNLIALWRQTDLILSQALQTAELSFEKIRCKIPQQFRRSMMPLCYPHSFALLNQKKLGNKIGVHQGTISRYINKYFEAPLLSKFKQFANQQLDLESYLTMFLETRFTNPEFLNLLDKTLIEAIQVLDDDAQKILKFRYSQKMNVAEIARALSSQKSREPKEIDLILVRTKNKLQEQLLEQLGQWQTEYVKLWLKKYYREMMQAVLLNSFRELNYVMQEILQMRYCQKMDERRIMSFYPDFNPTQTLGEARKQLQCSVLDWVKCTLRVSLASENQQVMEMVEDWLSKNLIYIDL